MHQVIVDSLEEYIGGALAPAARRDFEAHLETCGQCRREVDGMLQMSSLFDSLRTAEPVEAPAGFYARVTARVNATAQAPSFWSLFSLDAAFGRRVVFSSLLTLAVLGGVLVSRETTYAPGPQNPAAVMADDGASRDTMLVTLTSYEP